MPSILTNPYIRFKIPKSHQNVMQALAVDLCRKSNIKYSPDIRTDFNKFNGLQFTTLAALIKRAIINYKFFENKFIISSVLKRKITDKQIITKARSLADNESILGFDINNKPVYITFVNKRPAVFGDISNGLTSVVIIKTGTTALKRWLIITSDDQFGDHQIHLNDKQELLCKYHHDDCIALELIKHQKLEPGEYRFMLDFVDETDVDLGAPALILGSITDNSLNDSKYKYKEYADGEEQINFMYNLIEHLIRPLIWDVQHFKDFMAEHQDEVSGLLKESTTTLDLQEKRKIANKITTLIEEEINFEPEDHILSDTDAVFEHLNISPGGSSLSEDEIAECIDDLYEEHKLKCDREDLEWGITKHSWQDVIDMLCENYGDIDNVNKKIKQLLDNSSIYMAIPARIFSDFANTEVKPCYLTNSKPGTYLKNRLTTDLIKHNSNFVNILSFPKYGMVGTKDYPLYNTDITNGYGSIIVELKEVLKKRATICLGDSLDYPISPVSDTFYDFNIYNFVGLLINYPEDSLDTVLLEKRLGNFMVTLNNIMDPESTKYGLDMNYLLPHAFEYTSSYFEVQIKGDLMLTERDIKAIYVSDAADSDVVATVLKEEKLNIPMKYSKPFRYSETNKLVSLSERQGKEK